MLLVKLFCVFHIQTLKPHFPCAKAPICILAQKTATGQNPAHLPVRSPLKCSLKWALNMLSSVIPSADSTSVKPTQTVQARVRAALDAGLKVILCVGEVLEQREQGITEEVVALQTKVALGGVSEEELSRIVIAYEPVWAIGTGKTATADQAEEVCAFIRSVVAKLYSKAAADALTIQYGGSMKPGNAKELLSKEDVDGGLIGGAALVASDFAAIIEAAR